ncbi:LysM peptidoglycan-binding domain-containing protein [Tropicibacter sp. R15_0]|uniref:LysM peptidoglycan-binding domain-containing protein n=1 Tax=Tropicibacter sp. R15_0 TaxID=2821101 RepID=UPI001AD9927A|nr:LysM peptidoglycan-binding domain-containing protein [Tropicibacter sp. R15_0]MBO9464975.1 LysM peptidoglycan-binding domain-containing protein [Tropicibacter sp. R15_0]
MSKLALYSAIAGTGGAAAVAVAVVTGVIELPGSEPSDAPQPAAAAPEVAVDAPKPGQVPAQGAEASLVAEPAAPIAPAEPVQEPDQEAVVTPEPETAPVTPPVAEAAEDAPEAEPELAEVKTPDPQDAPEVAQAPEESEDDPVVEAVEAAEPETAPEDAEEAAPAPTSDITPELAKTDEPVATPTPVPAPRFDIVRAETDGSTLVAGEAEPGTQLEIIVNGEAAETVDVGSDGKFVSFVDLPAAGASSVLTLRNETPEGSVVSEEQVIVTPAVPVIATKDPEPAVDTPKDTPVETAALDDTVFESADVAVPAVGPADLPEQSKEAEQVAVAEPPAPEADSKEPQAPALPSEVAPLAEPKPAAVDAPSDIVREEPEETEEPAPLLPPTVLLASPRGVEVLQTAPVSPGEVALDSISYDDEGEVLLAGRGKKTASVRVYLDNTPITTSRIREDGRWRVELPQVDTGTYTLRVDQIDDSGAVIARVESPFLRESAELLASAASGAAGPLRSITVQPGHTLWEISTDRYGEGRDYVRVFEANRDRIRDPDLIYPGQVFDLPE